MEPLEITLLFLGITIVGPPLIIVLLGLVLWGFGYGEWWIFSLKRLMKIDEKHDRGTLRRMERLEREERRRSHP
jgi:hypothetical protein